MKRLNDYCPCLKFRLVQVDAGIAAEQKLLERFEASANVFAPVNAAMARKRIATLEEHMSGACDPCPPAKTDGDAQ